MLEDGKTPTPPHAYEFVELILKQPSSQKQYTESTKSQGNPKGILHRHKKQNPKETQKTPESHRILKKKRVILEESPGQISSYISRQSIKVN